VKPGKYGSDDGIVAGAQITVTAKAAGASVILIGTTTWSLQSPIFNDEETTVTIPDIEGVQYSVDGQEVPAGVHDGTAKAKMVVAANDKVTGKKIGEWAHTFFAVSTPQGPKFNSGLSISIPSDFGIRYWIRVDGKVLTKEGFEFSKPGTYTEADGLKAGVPVTITATPNGNVILKGETEWVYQAPTFDDEATEVSIPEVEGIEYLIDGKPVAAGKYEGTQKVKMTVTATDESGTQSRGSWTHTFPVIATPKGPTFSDVNDTVTIPSDWGVHYLITVDGKTITKEGLEFSKPGTYTLEEGLKEGTEIQVEAIPSGTVLTGTTKWTHTFPVRPSYDIAGGDEFNGAGINKNWNIANQKTSSMSQNDNFIYIYDGVRVKDGNLEIITQRHCLVNGEEPTSANVQSEPCTSGKKTVYTSGRVMSDFIYNAPFKMEVRAKMASNDNGQAQGMHFAAWMANNQKYCNKDIPSSNIAEIDTMELYGDSEVDTHTSHISCVANAAGKDITSRDHHVMPAAVAGKWHTYTAIWDGYSIEYLLDGRPVPQTGSTETKTTAETVGLSEGKFKSVLNDNPWRLIVNNAVFANHSWKAAPDNTKVFDTRVDVVDYIKMTSLKDVSPTGAIQTYWEKSGGHNGCLGYPTGPEIAAKGGSYQDFAGGRVVYNSSREQVFTVKGGVLNEYKSVRGTEGVLGFPVSEEKTLKGGSYQTFEHGKIHWSSATHGHYTMDAIQKYWAGAKWEKGWLGYPKADPLTISGGVSQSFQGGTVFWNSKSGKSFAVKGGIKTAYAAQGWEQGSLGFPVREEGNVKGGASQRFEHGVIFWSSKAKRAYVVSGEILAKYAAVKYEQGSLGFPTTDEQKLTDGVSQSFEHGQIHWSQKSGAHVTGGGIQTYWSKSGWEKGDLGYPMGDELKISGGASQSFEGGTVFWNSKRAKAFMVRNDVRNIYRSLKWERGLLGLPTSEEKKLADGVSQSFERGQIHWSQASGGFATTGAIQTYWSKQGWEKGWLGYPTSEEKKTPTGATQSFQGGTLIWSAKNHIVTSRKK
jgi:uncharacterized protein with LGFP repeats